MSGLSLSFIANSGVLIDGSSVRILVDGIYGKNPHFTLPRKNIQKAVFGMNSVYRNIDYLLFTHRHTDHFDAAYTDEYVKNNSVKGVYVPEASNVMDSYLEDQRQLKTCRACGILNEFIPEVTKAVRFELERDIVISYYRTEHLDGKSYPVINAGILLEMSGKRIFFAADSDYGKHNKDILAELGKLDCILVTPLFLVHPAGRDIIERISPGRVVIYHLPDETDDSSGLIELSSKVMNYEYCCPISAFTAEGQILEI